MSIETYYLLRRGEPRPAPLPELSVVELLRDGKTDDGRSVPAGACGTIVGIWGGGEAYEVEFVQPLVGLATVTADALRPASSSS
ncbi:DUF4926 domain-containing protein [Methylobacterium durans]|uniref:DUF4926 domain-containing protein n=1 Tax=Methylobacterium durans TaxID=2202825 RepID=UPI002AFE5722|nr:DUF4926 domain-containing protein [Methylobacterium durans]MEA1832886.1 DUF4926 domain-containing protein [Methylobacterium durans]